jgi:hypothetical protein
LSDATSAAICYSAQKVRAGGLGHKAITIYDCVWRKRNSEQFVEWQNNQKVMKWKNYVGGNYLIGATTPILPGGIDKKQKNVIMVSIATKIRTTHLPITSQDLYARQIQPSAVLYNNTNNTSKVTMWELQK